MDSEEETTGGRFERHLDDLFSPQRDSRQNKHEDEDE